MRKSLRILLWVLGLLAILIGGFVLWGYTPAKPMPEALSALQSDAQVTVTDNAWLTFAPTGVQPDTGLIFYPGGRVEPRAYAPAAHAIAAQGYLVILVRMPLNLAVLNPAAAADVIDAHPEIRYWAMGGHSLGGAMAANFAFYNPDEVHGLVLWAAYPASNNDLSASGLNVASIYGTLDGLATGEKIDASRPLLPRDTTWVAIEGGNHAQFGWYGEQSGDNAASISRPEQQAQVISATIVLLESLR
jgi:acetyl esterase/lipase